MQLLDVIKRSFGGDPKQVRALLRVSCRYIVPDFRSLDRVDLAESMELCV